MPVFIIHRNINSIYYTHALRGERAKYFPFPENSFGRAFRMSLVFDQHTGWELVVSRTPFILYFFWGYPS